jgi:hypothetical protein
MPTVTMYVRTESDDDYIEYDNIGKVDLPMPRPREGEYVKYDDKEYIIEDVIYNIDNATLEVTAKPAHTLHGRDYFPKLKE